MNWRRIAGYAVLIATCIAFYTVTLWVQSYTIGQLHWNRYVGTLASVIAFSPIAASASHVLKALGFGAPRNSN